MDRLWSREQEENFAVLVDWNLGNSCDYQCHYCHPLFRSGTVPFPDIEKAKIIVDRIAAKHHASNRMVRFSFVGGEPSQWSDLPELCRHIRETAWYEVRVMTNGAAPLPYWERLIRFTDLIVTYHEGRTDIGHLKALIDLARQHYRKIEVVFAMDPETFWQSLERRNTLSQFGIATCLQPLYRDHHRRSQLAQYDDAMLAVLFPPQPTGIVVETNGEPEEVSVDHLIYEKRNSFTGMWCAIGIDQIVISPNGVIRGGWCGVGGKLGNVHDGDFTIPEEPLICTKATCDNPNDLAVPKWKID